MFFDTNSIQGLGLGLGLELELGLGLGLQRRLAGVLRDGPCWVQDAPHARRHRTLSESMADEPQGDEADRAATGR